MAEFHVRKRKVGGDAPAFIVAEACDNHMGNVDVAREMALRAKLAGADAVKYQHHLPEEEMLPDTPMSKNMTEPLFDFLKKHALTLAQHRELKHYCDEIGIQYMCTPFSYKAAEELVEARLLDVIKIGSGEMTDIPSLERMTSFGLPMIVSTGMCEIGVEPHIVEAVVNHVGGHKGGVAGIYNRATYAPQMKVALARWADHVRGLIDGECDNNVVKLPKRA